MSKEWSLHNDRELKNEKNRYSAKFKRMLDAKNTSLLKTIISYRELVILNYNCL